MPKIAQIIVDVPAMQTDRPFDYLIPASWQDHILPGMRVEVPFGSRNIQGFVVGLVEETTYQDNLKPITGVMDLTPVLSAELLSLSDYMVERTFAFKISCLQAMLPSMMRAKYEKHLTVIDELTEQEQFELFKGKETISWKDAEDRHLLPMLAKLKKEDKIEISYEVVNKVRVKKIRMVKPLLTFEQMEEEKESCQKRAPKQALVLSYLQSLVMEEKEIASVQLQQETNVTSAVLKQMAQKNWLTFYEKEAYRNPYQDRVFKQTEPMTLTSQQQQVITAILQAVDAEQNETFLLKGVTGSGKTEVYLQTISKVVEQGKQAVMLVPEIALTPQMVERFKGRFGEAVAVLHSGLSEGEKYDEWRKIERGEAKIVVGARSAVFAPFQNLGVIIVDEEHESTYKQEDNPRYHARDVAIWRGVYHRCPVILGSATPSLESRARAQKNVYTLLELTERVNQQQLPEVEIIDMKDELKAGNRSSFATSLQNKIRGRIAKGEQTVLLLNRRGYSSFVMCRDCGFVLGCPNCDISLTLHMDTKTMKCHYCGHEEAIPRECPSCHGHHIRYYGTGTQKIEEELLSVIPEARVIRMDVDTTRKKGAHERLLAAFEQGEADILLGTQMIAKGLDFPNITLVGVLNADTALGLPDFRAGEKTFQLLTQVSGRPGRGKIKGEVVVQTFNPEHYAIQLAKDHDYDRFYAHEMMLRHRGKYPPYYYTVLLTTSHQNEIEAAKKMQKVIEEMRPQLSEQTIILGPTPKSIAKVNNRYYYQCILKYKNEPHLFDILHQIIQSSQGEIAKGLYLSVDPEPLSFM